MAEERNKQKLKDNAQKEARQGRVREGADAINTALLGMTMIFTKGSHKLFRLCKTTS